MQLFFNHRARGFTSTSEKRRGSLLPWRPSAIEGKALRAFTLIEMMVAVTIFAIVMMIGVGALLSLVETNKRAQAIHQVMSSLSAALEGMSRSIRVGSTYHCETFIAPMPQPNVLDEAQSCDSNTGGILLAIEASDGDRDEPDDQIVYRLNGTKLERSLNAGDDWIDLTSSEVNINSFKFYVVGAELGDGLQPRVLMSMQGTIELPRGPTSFHVQSTVVQRLIDL